jgi:cell division protease FtsH
MQKPPAIPIDYGVLARGPRRWWRGPVGWLLFIGLVIMLLLLLQRNRPASVAVTLSDFNNLLAADRLSEISLSDNEAIATVPRGYSPSSNMVTYNAVRVELPNGLSGDWSFLEQLMQHSIVKVDRNDNLLANLLLPLIPWAIIFLFIWFFVFRQLRRQTKESGRVQHFI